MQLHEINIYPVKSFTGISLTSSEIAAYGLKHDRKWMLIDKNNRFISQRSHPEMALLGTAIRGHDLLIFRKNSPEDHLIIKNGTAEVGEELEVTIWEDKCRALRLTEAYDQWLSQVMKEPVTLVYMPDSTKRNVNSQEAGEDDMVGFADAFPFLLIGTASLKDLNEKLAEPVPMARFRPNLVVETDEPFAEDRWKVIQVGEAEFEVAKPCSRCNVTTVNTQTGQAGKEPLKTLATYRTIGHKVMFGQNLLLRKGKTVRTGDEVKVLSLK